MEENVKSMTDEEYYATQSRVMQELIESDRRRVENVFEECFGGTYLLGKLKAREEAENE